jgi:D-Tyr-tRNAtyr deacylase
MRAVVQRVSSASVTIDGVVTAQISRGLLILLGIHHADTEADVEWLAAKTAALRIFEDAAGKMNLSVTEVGRVVPNAPPPHPPSLNSQPSTLNSPASPSALVVSQFTLIASTRKGTRPSFNDAAKPDIAIPLYESFNRRLSALLGHPVATGTFGAMMQVALVNDGPVTIVLDSRQRD